jgi:tRNA A-37 threonylcarbamoyl transferase component Bud32
MGYSGASLMSDSNSYVGVPATWAKPEDLVGTTLADRYKVKSVLGDGGMGSVFLGEHVTLRKRVAIKVLHPELCRDQTQVDRFLQEARAASMIGHENIVDIVDFGPVPGGSVFFAMEHLDGEDLADLLKRERRLPWARTKGLMLQIVGALAAAHDKGIIHRDLKPANCFLVKRSDGRDFVKLLDFGIAKVNDPEAGDASGLTRTGAVFGTAKYMAPEQACGEPADARTDIYAAAVCLYEFLTGQVPFDGDNFMRVLSRHLTEPLTLPSTMAPDANISHAVESLIVKALSKKREDRYQSMGEFAEALRAIGPDGNLIAGQMYEGPPQVGPAPAGSTMWLDPSGQANQGPTSQPPEGRGGTLLLDADSAAARLAAVEGGTVRLSGPTGWAGTPPPAAGGPAPPKTVMADGTMVMDGIGQDLLPAGGGAVITRTPPGAGMGAPSTTPPTGPETRPPTFNDRTGDYTEFVDGERRSKGKFIALLLGGAAIAIGLGGAGAYFLLGPSDRGDQTELPTPTKVAQAEKDDGQASLVPDAPKKAEPTTPDEPLIPETPPVEPDPDPPPETPSTEKPPVEPDPPPAKTESTNPPPRNNPANTPSSGGVKAALTSKDIDRVLGRLGKTVTNCGKTKGALPGTRVQVDYTINSEGQVLRATAKAPHTSSPLGQCVAGAVSRAKFPKSKQPLNSQSKTFAF